MTTIKYPTETEPWIWLQEDEEEGSADCGCNLLQDPDSGAKFSFCTMHAAAEEMLQVLVTIAKRAQVHGRTVAIVEPVLRKARGGPS